MLEMLKYWLAWTLLGVEILLLLIMAAGQLLHSECLQFKKLISFHKDQQVALISNQKLEETIHVLVVAVKSSNIVAVESFDN